MLRWFRSYTSSSSVLPRPSGPFSVGFVDYEWAPLKSKYTSSPPSHILTRIYYPSLPVVTTQDDESPQWKGRSHWIPSKSYYPGYGYYLGMPWYISSPLFKLVVGNTPIWAVENAPPTKHLSSLPVVIFSHGLGGMRTTYSSLCTDLASHGYIVAAIEHRILNWLLPRLALIWNRLLTRVRDGSASMSYLQNDETILCYQHPPDGDTAAHLFRSVQLSHRSQEVSATIDLLLAENSDNIPINIWKQRSGSESATIRDDLVSDPLSLLLKSSQVRRDNVGVAGHSFGAATCFMSAQQDDRINGILALDPWMFPLPDNFNQVVQKRSLPTLVINSSTFHWPTNLEALSRMLYRNYELEKNLSMQITLNDTSHLDQSDFSAIIPTWLRTRYRSGAISDPKEILSTNALLDRAFFDELLPRGVHEQADILDRDPQSHSTILDQYKALLWKDGNEIQQKFKIDIKL